MDDILGRFLKKIGITNLAPFEGACFSSLLNDKENNRIIACIKLDHYLDYDVYQNFFDTISTFIAHGGFGMRLTFEYHDEKIKDFERLLEQFKEKQNCSMLDDMKDLGEHKVLFYYQSADGAFQITEETKKLKDFLDSITSSYSILMQEKVFYGNDFGAKRDEAYQERSNRVARRMKEIEEIQTHYQPCKLKDIEQFRMVIVEGTIFKLGEARKTKKNMTIQSIEYTDGSDSISSTLFESKRMPLEEINKYKVGTKIRVKGKPEHDMYAHDALVIKIDEIEILPPDPQREDTYPRKRVELHAHSKMSAFDGLASISDYAATAARWGHKAIALTDHGNVQAYPEAQKAAKKSGIKVIYGAELYVVNESLTYIYNPCDRELSKETYVVFDTETTGLSCRYDRLIEFGAVKMSATGQILDEIDFFINPDGHQLSRFTREVSHISQEEVDHGKPIKKALNDILEFFGDSIIVAHNAAFDFDFINEALKNNGMPTIQNPVIDTLPLARYMYPGMRAYREEVLARKFEIDFDATGAHRANYDAAHLAQIFDAMLSQLLEKNPHLRHEEL